MKRGSWKTHVLKVFQLFVDALSFVTCQPKQLMSKKVMEIMQEWYRSSREFEEHIIPGINSENYKEINNLPGNHIQHLNRAVLVPL